MLNDAAAFGLMPTMGTGVVLNRSTAPSQCADWHPAQSQYSSDSHNGANSSGDTTTPDICRDYAQYPCDTNTTVPTELVPDNIVTAADMQSLCQTTCRTCSDLFPYQDNDGASRLKFADVAIWAAV